MILNYTIYGERCSSTNYLQNLMELNFDIDVTWKYGWKHFFGFRQEKLIDSENTLFICIVRNLNDWLNSLYIKKHHLPIRYILSKKKLNNKNTIFWPYIAI